METPVQTLQTESENPLASDEPASEPVADDYADAAQPASPEASDRALSTAQQVHSSENPRPQSLAEVIAHQLESLKRYREAVLETEDAEAVHKMRVTTRRLQASIDLLQSGANELKVRALKRRLRRWRRRLSMVRNYDVFLLMLDAEASTARASRRQHFEVLKAELEKRRAVASLKMNKYLQEITISSVADKLGIITEPGAASSTAEPPVQSSSFSLPAAEAPTPASALPPSFAGERKIARRAADRLDQRLAELKTMAADAQPSTDPAEIHRLRIAAKRLRYLMEAVSHLGYGDASRAIGWLRVLQDNLGDWHDIDAFEDEVVDIVCRPKFMKAHLVETAGLLDAVGRLLKKKDALTKKTFPVKPPATLGRTSTRLSRALRRSASLGH